MTYLPIGREAGTPARLGVARLGTTRLGAAFPGDVSTLGFVSSEVDLPTDTGDVLLWGLNGTGGGMDGDTEE